MRFLRTSYQRKHLTLVTLGLLLTTLSTTIASDWLAASDTTVSSEAAVAATLVSIAPSSVPSLPGTAEALQDYQPPDNGGPGRTGGSGTRWRSSDSKQLGSLTLSSAA